MGHRVASSTLAVIARRGLSPGGSTGPAARDCLSFASPPAVWPFRRLPRIQGERGQTRDAAN